MSDREATTKPQSKALRDFDDLLDRVFPGGSDEIDLSSLEPKANRNQEKNVSPEDQKYFYARHIYTAKVIELAYRVSPQHEAQQDDTVIADEWEDANSQFESRPGDPVIDQAFALADHIAREGTAPDWAHVGLDYSGSLEWYVKDTTETDDTFANLPA